MKFTLTNQPCLGVVLAGGLSTRMGKDKALLTRNNINMLDYAKQLLINAGTSNIITSGNNHQVADIVDQAGPVGGIYSVIKRYRPHAILIMPVDLPLMTSEALAKLKQIGELNQSACFYEGHNIPLYLPVNAFVEIFLDKTFKNGSFKQSGKGPSLGQLLAQVPHKTLKIKNKTLLFNTNTPQEWQQAEQVFSKTCAQKQNN
jgi:molybdopterin-guanine dinucleotide biosynthesis protein A